MSLQGKITHKDLNFIILEAGGIGYQVFFAQPAALSLDGEIKVFLHEHIREDRHDLYGFLDFSELEFFNKLLSVDGVGPKMAMNICSLGIEKIQKAVAESDPHAIESVHGVGKKTAQKIILELKGSLDKILEKSNLNKDALNALINLGYNRAEAEEVLREISAEISGTEAQIKAALKLLGSK